MAPCDRFWAEPPGAPSAEWRAHAQGCAECQALSEAFASNATPVSPALATRAKAELAAHPRVYRWWVKALALPAVWLGMLLYMLRPWSREVLAPGFGGLGLPLAAVLLVAFGAAGWLALSPRRGGVQVGGVAGVAIAVGAMLASCGLRAGDFHMVGACATAEVLTSVLPLGVAVLLLRRSAFSWTRAVAGIFAAGGVGVLLLELICPNASLAHVLSSHVVPWLATCAVALVVRRALPSASFAP